MYENSKRKRSGCASNLLAHEDLRHLRKPIIGIYKPSSIIKNSYELYESESIGDSLYEKHGATLKHKCGKDSNIAPSLFFSHFFFSFSFSSFVGLILAFFYFVRFLIPTYGGIIVSIILSSLGTML